MTHQQSFRLTTTTHFLRLVRGIFQPRSARRSGYGSNITFHPRYLLPTLILLAFGMQVAGTSDAGRQVVENNRGSNGTISEQFEDDCIDVDLKSWQHKTRRVLEGRKEVHIEWVKMCRKRTYPVYGVRFDYDPQGQTRDFFHPLFWDMLEANHYWPYAFVAVNDGLVIRVYQEKKFELMVDYQELADAKNGREDLQNGGAEIKPEDSGSVATDAAVLEVVEAPVAEKVSLLFDGDKSDAWQEYAVAGGNFKEFAQYQNNKLVIDVPAGSGWGKTGIWSTKPVVKVPGNKQAITSEITFAIDQGYTSDFVFSLVPPDGAKAGRDDWWNHDIRVGISTDKESHMSTLTLWLKRKEAMKINIEPFSLDLIRLILRPDGVLLITDKSGKILLQGLIPEDHPDGGYHIYAFSHAAKQNLATKMSLLWISLTEGEYEQGGDPSQFLAASQKTVVFDGQVLGRHWIKYRAHGGDFDKHAKLIDGVLAVDVPEKSNWGKVGLMSPEPLIWLDKFTDDAEVSLTFTFDPEKTTGFMIGLATRFGLNGNDPGNPRYLLHWRKTKEGKSKAGSVIDYKDHIIGAELSGEMPDTVKLVLTAEGIKVEADGFPATLSPWKELMDGQGFRVYVYTHPDEKNQPVKMALKQVLLERKAGKMLTTIIPEKGVEPLPVKVFFDGKPNDQWQLSSIAGDAFLQYCKFDNDRLIVDVPEKKSQWGKTGLLSTEPILKLDERILSTTHKTTIKVDPKGTSGFQIMLHPSKVANMWGQHMSAAVSFIRVTEGKNKGHHLLSLRSSDGPYGIWERAIDSEWVDQNWDGTIVLENGDRWMAVHIPDGASVRGTPFSLGKGSEMFMTVYSHPEKTYRSSQLALQRIASEWVMPRNMTQAQRWNLIDDESFDADAFLDDLSEDVFPE